MQLLRGIYDYTFRNTDAGISDYCDKSGIVL